MKGIKVSNNSANKPAAPIPNQWNITAIVGNGFDLSILGKYSRELTTSYKSFYYYLRSINFDENNEIFRQMRKSKQAGDENWSDFEYALEAVAKRPNLSKTIIDDLSSIQSKFSKFLTIAITPDLIDQLDHDAQASAWAYRTHAEFVADLSDQQYRNFQFRTKVRHYDEFRYNFFNLNYTPLLDIYLHLDRTQFEPRPHTTVDRNFDFRINPENVPLATPYPNSETGCSSYIKTDVHHPHGSQNIPRSLLFGTGSVDPDKNFSKAYWAQLGYKYAEILNNTNVFITFGSSLGSTDDWWWESIAERVSDPTENFAELIVYEYNRCQNNRASRRREIVEAFTQYAQRNTKRQFDIDMIDQRIFLITYDDPELISFLGFKPDTYNPYFRRDETYRRPGDHWTVRND